MMRGLSSGDDGTDRLEDRNPAIESKFDLLKVVDKDDQGNRLLQLTRTIETQIIPRLLIANTVGARWIREPSATTHRPSHENVEELTGLVLRQNTAAAMAYIEAVRSRGTGMEDVFLRLLAPTARHLGDLYDADLCNFAEVTIALSRLQQVLRAFSASFESEVEPWQQVHRAVLVPCQGEQHTFGLSMLEEFFRRAGWDVWSGNSSSLDEVLETIASEWIDIVGFSMSCESRIDELTADIRKVRAASVNRSVGVFVGGPAFLEHPELLQRVGADATATDGHEAVLVALRFVDNIKQRAD